MKNTFRIITLAATIALAVLLSPHGPPRLAPEPSATLPPAPTAEPPVAIASVKATTPPTPAAATPQPRLAGSPLAKELNAPTSDAARDVAALHGMLRQYLRQLRQRPGHPIGNDSDLARALTGQNPMHLVVLPPTHSALSPEGRLLDRFGTPYFIHPRGNGAFEIRSAGPDRKLFTPDDAVANPLPGRTEAVEAVIPGDDKMEAAE